MNDRDCLSLRCQSNLGVTVGTHASTAFPPFLSNILQTRKPLLSLADLPSLKVFLLCITFTLFYGAAVLQVPNRGREEKTDGAHSFLPVVLSPPHKER